MNEEQKNFQELQLRHMKLQTGLMVCMLVFLLVVGIFLMVQVTDAMGMARRLDLQKVNDTIASLESVASELNNVDMEAINGAVTALKDAAGTLSEADIGAINEGIRALSSAADNLKDIDIDSFNALIESLQTVTDQMESTTSALAKIFGKK